MEFLSLEGNYIQSRHNRRSCKASILRIQWSHTQLPFQKDFLCPSLLQKLSFLMTFRPPPQSTPELLFNYLPCASSRIEFKIFLVLTHQMRKAEIFTISPGKEPQILCHRASSPQKPHPRSAKPTTLAVSRTLSTAPMWSLRESPKKTMPRTYCSTSPRKALLAWLVVPNRRQRGGTVEFFLMERNVFCATPADWDTRGVVAAQSMNLNFSKNEKRWSQPYHSMARSCGSTTFLWYSRWCI